MNKRGKKEIWIPNEIHAKLKHKAIDKLTTLEQITEETLKIGLKEGE